MKTGFYIEKNVIIQLHFSIYLIGKT